MNYRYQKYIVFLLAFLCLNVMQAQEVLTGLSHNPALMNQKQSVTKNRAVVNLPFFDDFSNYTGYPKAALWSDRQVFVNNTFPLYPPTIGVATLDALDENGMIYAHAETRPFGADTLTSNPIRLDYNNVYHRPMQISDSAFITNLVAPQDCIRQWNGNVSVTNLKQTTHSWLNLASQQEIVCSWVIRIVIMNCRTIIMDIREIAQNMFPGTHC